MKLLVPTPTKDKYWLNIEKSIRKIFFSVYKDLFVLIKPEQQLYNAKDPLSDAIMASKVAFDNGSFSGKFNSSITKQLRAMGAKYNPSTKTWKMPTKDLPPNIQATLAMRGQKDIQLNEQAISIIDEINIGNIIDDSRIEIEYSKTVKAMNADIDKSIGIAFVLTEEQQEIIAEEWAENLDLYIRDFLVENILELREDVLDNTSRGGRAENLVDMIMSRYGVTDSKAKFLARQETSLLMSKMRETRYTAAGLEKYKWLTSNDERVRDRHKELNNKVFFWTDPPIVDEKGNRANPGEDFNCRCVAVPIIE